MTIKYILTKFYLAVLDIMIMNNFDNKIYSDTILSCSVDYQYDSELGEAVYVFNAGGPVYGPNGEWELDPDNDLCGVVTQEAF